MTILFSLGNRQISLIDSGQLLQLTSCIRDVSPYLYPAKDNHSLRWHTLHRITSHHGEYP